MSFIKEKLIKKRNILLVFAIFWLYIIFVHNPFGASEQSQIVKYGDTEKGISKEITNEQNISQKFVAVDNDLKSISIYVATLGRQNSGNISFKILDEENNIIGQVSTDMSNIEDNSWVDIDIIDQEESKDKNYSIEIYSDEATTGNAIVTYVGKSLQNATNYIQGDVEQSGTLCFNVEFDSSRIFVLKILCWIAVIICSFITVICIDKADEKSFLKLAIIIGAFVIVLNPFVHVLDESTHFFRSFMISQGDFIDDIDENGNIGGWVPSNYPSIANQRLTISEYLTNPGVWNEKFDGEEVFFVNPYMSSVTPLNHAVAAVGVFIGRLLHLPAILVIMLGRISDLALYIIFCYLAIKSATYYKTQFFVAATVPYGFWLGGSFSIDPILISSSLLFLSLCLKYYFNEDDEKVKVWEWIMLLVAGAFIASVKYLVYTPILLTFFLIPKKNFEKKQWNIVFILAIIMIIIMALVQIKMLGMFNFTEDRNGDVDVARQIQYMLNNKYTASRNILGYFVESQWGFFQGMTPVFKLETLARMLGVFVVFGGILETKKYVFKNKKEQTRFIVLMLFIFASIFMLTVVSLFFGFTAVGKFAVEGVQPRYLVPILIFLSIPISFIPVDNRIKKYDNKVVQLMCLGEFNMISGILFEVFK